MKRVMNSIKERKLTLLIKICRAINSTPVPMINRKSTLYDMNDYHNDLRATIKNGDFSNKPLPDINEFISYKRKRTKYRKCTYQLTDFLITSINVAACEFKTSIKFSEGQASIEIDGKYQPISKATFNRFLRVCLVGLAGDPEVLREFIRIKSEISRCNFD